MSRLLEWRFPLPRTHTGMLQANGRFGIIVWGEGSVLRLTLGRADLWDHRGGLPWTAAQSWTAIRRCLAERDEAGLRRLFEDTGRAPGTPRRPTVLPVGRIDLDFGPGSRLMTGTLDLDSGVAAVRLRRGDREQEVRLVVDMARPVLSVSLPSGHRHPEIRPVPAWEYVGAQLTEVGYEPPTVLDEDELAGWVQPLPADPALAVVSAVGTAGLAVAVETGGSPAAARSRAVRLARRALTEGYTKVQSRARKWWQGYWREVPKVDLPSERLRLIYDYGMYKFAGLTHPDGPAATLQGAWLEEYQLPPWSSDYHFNINVQMCYWPAYHGNRLAHLMPLFDMIEGWLPILRNNARAFLGIEDGLMLPHAVDDRCTCMGGFWTGTVDHGCTAWVAQMMYRYYRYTGDRRFLVERAYPFMKGAMRVYEEMLEREGEALVLPVGVSPEYRGSNLDAWGRNASFQLACIHRLNEDLLEAAGILGETPRPIWREIEARLPRACVEGGPDQGQIALWAGTVLEESHRHHSHLAGIVPFDVIDVEDPQWQGIVERSLSHWIRTGPGLWSGWCVPWASMIHSRVGNADAAELWLEIWERLFTNEGRGTLHDVHFPGFSLMGKGATCSATTRGEIMQIEAGMAAAAAVQEILLHVRRGVVVLFAGAPARWRRVGFTGMRSDGAFLVSARRLDGRVGPVRVKSLAGGTFRLQNPWAGQGNGSVLVQRAGSRREIVRGEVLEVAARAGEELSLRGQRAG
ncbi:MAG: hypothetical protein WDA75_18525 [Candidatus Latescibacterota bacterium]